MRNGETQKKKERKKESNTGSPGYIIVNAVFPFVIVFLRSTDSHFYGHVLVQRGSPTNIKIKIPTSCACRPLGV